MIVRREGITRTVYVGRRWAVKFPSLRAHGGGPAGMLWSFCRGVLANQSEATWSGMGGLCPVRWSLFGLVNVYPAAAPVSGPIDYAHIAEHPIPVDPKPGNVGVLDGQVVWVDYDMNWNDCRVCGGTTGGGDDG